MRDGFVNARDISNNMNTFTKVMADVAVANQQEINLMVQQMSEMAVRMNNAASQMENIMVETNKGGAGQNMARIIENLANASGRIEKATELLEKVATDPQTEADIKATNVRLPNMLRRRTFQQKQMRRCDCTMRR